MTFLVAVIIAEITIILPGKYQQMTGDARLVIFAITELSKASLGLFLRWLQHSTTKLMTLGELSSFNQRFED